MKLILMADNNNAIGRSGKQMVYLKSDLQHFKTLTTGHILLMGRNTFEDIGRPLPNRINIVYTSKNLRTQENLLTVNSHRELVETIKKSAPNRKIFLIGGAQLVQSYIDYVSEAYITRIDYCFANTDAFMPDFHKLNNWTLLKTGEVKEDSGYRYQLEFWKNKKFKKLIK